MLDDSFKHKTIIISFIVLIILVVGGCSKPPHEPMRVGTNIWIGYEPLYLARALNYLEPDHVKLVEYVSASQTMRSMIDGTVEAAALTLDEALLLQQHGVKSSIVLVMDYSNGADAVIAKPEIATLQDLRGRRVGLETSALGAYMMHRTLEQAGLSPNDVELVALELSQHESTFLEGRVDAVVTFDPVKSRLLAQGAHVLLDTRELPGEVVDVLVVRDELPQDQKTHLIGLLDAWFRAVKYIELHPHNAASHMKARVKLDETGVLKALDGVTLPDVEENVRLLGGNQPVLRQRAATLADVMKNNRLLRDSVQANDLFDHSLLQELYP